ncbi:MAG: PAS domain S-box protein [Sulfuricurvum sp.]
MKLKETLFLIMSGIFIVFITTVWLLSNLQSKSANETWGKKLIQSDLELKKQQTLHPIIQEIALLKKLSQEPALIAMAHDEFDPRKQAEGLKILERYRLEFHDKSYAATFVKTLHQYRNNPHSAKGDGSLYTLDPHTPSDQWFSATITSGSAFTLNVEMGIRKIWVNYVIKDHGRIVGVVGTSFNLNTLVKSQSKHTEIKSFFIKKDLSIQLSNDTRMMNDNGIANTSDGHKSLARVINDPKDIAKIKEAMETLSYTPNGIQTFWMNVHGEKNLVGIAYSPEVELYEVTFFDQHDLVLLDNRNLFIILSCLFFIAIIVVGMLVSRRILSPIQRLKEYIITFHKNNKQGQLTVMDSGEIGELTTSIQALLDQAYQQHATLSISKNHLEMILDHTSHAIAILDKHHRLVVINTVWEGLLGYSANALMGHSLETIIPSDAWLEHQSLLQTLDHPLQDHEQCYLTNGGERKIIRVNFIPMASHEILMMAQCTQKLGVTTPTEGSHPTLFLRGKEGGNTVTIQLTFTVEGAKKG